MVGVQKRGRERNAPRRLNRATQLAEVVLAEVDSVVRIRNYDATVDYTRGIGCVLGGFGGDGGGCGGDGGGGCGGGDGGC